MNGGVYMSKVKLCKFCKKHDTFRASKGYTNEWADDTYICPDCKNQMTDVDYPSKDFDIIKNISYYSVFIASMINLRKKDPIEYQLKMSQFKATQSQTKMVEESSQVQCPKCGCTNIQIVPRRWSLLTGFLTNKTDRVCVNCKHKF